jgi:hypothetical protein
MNHRAAEEGRGVLPCARVKFNGDSSHVGVQIEGQCTRELILFLLFENMTSYVAQENFTEGLTNPDYKLACTCVNVKLHS